MNDQQRDITLQVQMLDIELKTIIGDDLTLDHDLCGVDVEKFIDLKTIDDTLSRLTTLIKKTSALKNQAKEALMNVADKGKDNQQQLAEFVEIELNALQQHQLLATAYISIQNGEFFSSLDDVWDKIEMPFDTTDLHLFTRMHHAGDYYEKTAQGARNPNTQPTEDAGPSSSHSSTSKVSTKDSSRQLCNIFGAFNTTFESAHLMPHSSNCASCWYHFVPWVLSVSDIALTSHGQTDKELLQEQWTYMKKCIHGFSSAESGSNSKVITSSITDIVASDKKLNNVPIKDHGRETDAIDHVGNTTTDVDCTSNENSLLKPRNKSTDEGIGGETGSNNGNENRRLSSQKRRRIDHVGIKHLSSNRILLAYQKLYLDSYHCVLIIPIMDTEEVKNWKGEGYNAIVLASKFKRKENDAAYSPANEVYKHIEASSGPLLFATKSECDQACQLLVNMILCVCKSFKETFPIEFLRSQKLKKEKELLQAFHSLNLEEGQDVPLVVPVPKRKDQPDDVLNVRKIQFSDCTDFNPAPDPALLLGKSTSNWLKLHHLVLLPGCSDDDSISDSSNYTVSFSVEAAARGWTTENYKKPRVDEISFVPGDTLDESLSDDDDDNDDL